LDTRATRLSPSRPRLLGAHAAAADSYTYQTVELPFKGVSNVEVTGVTDLGKMVGTYHDDKGIKSWYFDHKKGFTRLTQSGKTLIAQDVNMWARTLGYYFDRKGRAGAWTKHSGHFSTFNAPPEYPETVFCALNDLNIAACSFFHDEFTGGVALWHAKRKPEPIRTVPTPPEWHPTVTGINNHGDLVGYIDNPGEPHGVYRGWKISRDGTIAYLDAPCGAAGTWTVIHDINDQGLMTATCHDAPNAGAGALLTSYVTDGTAWTEVKVPDSHETYVKRLSANATIVGSYYTLDGQIHGFIASPAPMNLARR
jgi:hypothetical protein